MGRINRTRVVCRYFQRSIDYLIAKMHSLITQVNEYKNVHKAFARCCLLVTYRHMGPCSIQRESIKTRYSNSIFIQKFYNCWPIFKILSPAYSFWNLKRNLCYICHHTLNVSLHYLAKCTTSKTAKRWWI